MTTQERINIIRDLPLQLEQLIGHLTPEQLTTTYNAPEWTIAQNVHHLADTHMQGFTRFKFCLTEENPDTGVIKVNLVAEMPDSMGANVMDSLMILQGIHQRWVILLSNMNEDQWQRIYTHPVRGVMTLDDVLTLYSNHCQAHLKQIREVMEKMSE
jgi:hypothetical protein